MSYTREDCKNAVEYVIQQTDKEDITTEDYKYLKRDTDPSLSTVYRFYDEWDQVVREAGRRSAKRYTREELIESFRKFRQEEDKLTQTNYEDFRKKKESQFPHSNEISKRIGWRTVKQKTSPEDSESTQTNPVQSMLIFTKHCLRTSSTIY